MPHGKYKGTPLGEVPAHWYMWINNIIGIDRTSELGIYITENIEAIRERNNQSNAAVTS